MVGLALLAAPALVGAAPGPTIGPPEPRLPAPATPPEPGPSQLPARMWASLRPAIARLEKAVPTDIGTSGRFERDEEGVALRCRVERGPFELTARHDTLFVRAKVSYWLSARGDGFAQVECGSERDPRIAWFGSMIRIGWSDDWRLDSRAARLPITHDRKCKPKPPGIDFTEIMTHRIAERMARPLIDAIPGTLADEVPLRPGVVAVWEAVRDPVELGRGRDLWLDYRARRMLASPLTLSGDSLRIDLAVEVRPRLVASRPSSGRDTLADPRVRVIGDPLQVAFDCTVTLDSLARRIREQCDEGRGEKTAAVQVSGVFVRGGGDRLAVSIETSGRLAGRVHLTGQVRYNDRAHALSVGGLDYSSETRAALRGQPQDVLEALQGIRDRVEAALVLDLSSQVVAAASPIGRAVNRALGPQISIAGGMNQRRLLGIVVTDRAVVARLVAAGRTWLDLR